MRDAKLFLILAGACLAFSACGRDEQPDVNQLITDINAADPGDIEAVPPDESVDPVADDASGEETGDGDDMVNIVDDTGNRG